MISLQVYFSNYGSKSLEISTASNALFKGGIFEIVSCIFEGDLNPHKASKSVTAIAISGLWLSSL